MKNEHFIKMYSYFYKPRLTVSIYRWYNMQILDVLKNEVTIALKEYKVTLKNFCVHLAYAINLISDSKSESLRVFMLRNVKYASSKPYVQANSYYTIKTQS